MKRNPRPVLIGLSVINLVALIVVLTYQLNGLAQLAPLRDALTGLLAALLAGVIALYTVDYLNEQNQSREWERKVLDWNGKELLKALEPIYDEIVGNRDSSRELVAGSKVAWNRLMKGSRRERVPAFLWPELTSYYDKVEAQQDVYFQTWKSVKTSVDTTHESQKVLGSSSFPNVELSELVMEAWSQLVDGLDTPLDLKTRERYQGLLSDAGITTFDSNKFLLEIKETASTDAKLLREKSQELIEASDTLLGKLKPVFLRPWDYMPSLSRSLAEYT